MPLYSADALILRTYKLGEADRIVVFLTRDRGKKRGVAKGARRTKSNFVGALERDDRGARLRRLFRRADRRVGGRRGRRRTAVPPRRVDGRRARSRCAA